MHPDHVGFGLALKAPDPLHQRIRGDFHFRVPHQHLQQLEFLVGQLLLPEGCGNLISRTVQGQVPEGQSGVLLLPLHPGHRPDPGHQFLHFERLGQVIVGAAVQPGDLVIQFGFCRQHDHRHIVPPFPEFLQRRDAVHQGHHDVQYDAVVLRRFGVIQHVQSVVHHIHRVIVLLQNRGHCPGQGFFVFRQ